jgi:N-acetylglucosaminyl-diphospho-decaprenol L-rhamnosyltransferase
MMSGTDPEATSPIAPLARGNDPAAHGTIRVLDVATLIVTYRSARLTIECLHSIHAERSTVGLHVRVIVVDNSSGDLPAIAQAVERNDWSSWITLVQAPVNGGFAYGINLGVERAYAEGVPDYLYVLNPDTQVRAGAIDSLARFLETHPEVAIAGSSFENRDGSGWPIAFRFPTLVSELIQGLGFGPLTWLLQRWVVARRMTGKAQRVDWVSGASMMIRSNVFAALGGIDENYFLYFEETDFCRRARRAGFFAWYVPESRVMHVGAQSTHITHEASVPQRLPAYWFESRRRYFALSFGVGQATVIDVVALVAHSLGWLKRTALRQPVVPYFVRDLARHSILRARNRKIPAIQGRTTGAKKTP